VEEITTHETFRSINEPVLWFGIERRLLVTAAALDYAIFQFLRFFSDYPFLIAAGLLAGFVALAWHVTKTDAQLPKILVRNLDQKTFYDPFLYERRK
jgi:type IV secretory pathway TrbD component